MCNKKKPQNPYNPKYDPNAWSPNNLKIIRKNIHTVKLSWNQEEEQIDGFKIDKKVKDENWEQIITELDKNTKIYIDTTAIPGKQIRYRVYAYADTNNSAYISESINVKFPPPSNLVISQKSLNEIEISWKDNCEGEEEYIVRRKIGNKNSYSKYATLPENTNIWTDSEPVYGKYNYYGVLASKGKYKSQPVMDKIKNIINRPTDLKAIPLNDQRIELVWKDNCEFESGFELERKKENNEYVTIANLEANTSKYIDKNLSYHTKYSYRIRAITEKYASSYSTELSVKTVFPTPDIMTFSNKDKNYIGINWKDNCNFEKGYIIERKKKDNSFHKISVVDSSEKEYKDYNIIPGVEYIYRVAAYTDINKSKYSKNDTAKINFSDNFVSVKGGTFKMGNNNSLADERPVHEVKLDNFFISRNKVNQFLYYKIMKDSTLKMPLNNTPKVNVTWNQAIRFCNKLSELHGYDKCYYIKGSNVTCNFKSNGYRLPTEAEWEHIANKHTHKDSTKLNIALSGKEWCHDRYFHFYYIYSPKENPKGSETGTARVIRELNLEGSNQDRINDRDRGSPDMAYDDVGFRLVRYR